MEARESDKPEQSWPWRRAIVAALVPFMARRILGTGLTVLGSIRLIVTTVFVAMALLLIVVGVSMPWGSSEPVPGHSWAVVGFGAVIAAVGVVVVRRRQVPCGDAEQVANAYRGRALIGVAVAEVPALLSFLAAFLADQAWLYLVGAVIAAVAFAMVAPTEGDLDRKESELRAQGCAVSLRQALSTTANPS